ncbi:hypothetical protein [Xanthomonas translucens]|uniref:hypothetical protein n=1 Tax=Xanthomonas campestris pv. translucens TaxID=343 RepID=UPI001C3FF785|nr:hypothetical protein [Xanthomonas translucens]
MHLQYGKALISEGFVLSWPIMGRPIANNVARRNIYFYSAVQAGVNFFGRPGGWTHAVRFSVRAAMA